MNCHKFLIQNIEIVNKKITKNYYMIRNKNIFAEIYYIK